MAQNTQNINKKYENILESAFMLSPAIICILRGSTHIFELANEMYMQTIGQRDIIGKPIREALPELEGQGFFEILDEVYKTEKPIRVNEILAKLDEGNGKTKNVYVNLLNQPNYDKNGTLIGILAHAIDVTEQVLARKRVEESEKRYNMLLMKSPFGFAILKGKEMVITLANDSIKEFWGKGQNVEGTPLLELLPQLKDLLFPSLLQTVYTTGIPYYGNEQLAPMVRNGKLENAYFNFIYQPYLEANEVISGVTIIAYDVSETVLIRKKIEESEAKFRMLMEDVPVATCFLLGKEMKIEVANDMVLTCWGKDKSVIGRNLADAIPELKGQPFLQLLDDVFTTGVTYEAKNELAQLEVNGTLGIYYFDYVYKPIRNALGEVYGIVSIAIDVTEQVITEQKLRVSLEQFSAMADNISQLAWMMDEKGHIYWYNQRWYDYTGTTHEEMHGLDWGTMHHPSTVDATIARFKAAITTGTDWEDTFLLRGKDGTYRWFLSRAVPIKDNEGKIIRWFGTKTDITEQKEANTKAQEAKIIAEEATKAKQQFLSNMSHEIRTPMNAIIGFTNVLLKTALEEKQRKYINAIKTSGDSLIVLINDILDLAKVDAGKMVFQCVPFQLANSLTTILNIFEIKVQEKNTKLILKYDNNIPEMLLGDPARLHQILINLMSNAIKFTTEGQIIVSVDLVKENEQKATISFSVEDTGVGISSKKIEIIFDAFEQATHETSQLFGGTGLGLNIVKQLVEHQGGKVSVKSQINKGSTFSFVMSFDKTTQATEIEPEIESPPNLENTKILVVEDVRLNQLLIKILLEDLGIMVELAENGKIAIGKLQTNHYDMIFMDLHMPEMNGFEATEHIRSKMNMDIPIIAITADVTTVDVEKCKAIGMNDYISKPIDEQLLYKKIIKYLPKTR